MGARPVTRTPWIRLDSERLAWQLCLMDLYRSDIRNDTIDRMPQPGTVWRQMDATVKDHYRAYARWLIAQLTAE